MNICAVHLVAFSPTHTSKQVGEAIVRGTGVSEIMKTDLTLHPAGKLEIPENTLAVITVDIGYACYLYASHTSAYYIGYAGELHTVHVSARNGTQYVYSQTVQAVHGGEDAEIEECAPYCVRTLCGKVLPKREVDACSFLAGWAELVCLSINNCPC